MAADRLKNELLVQCLYDWMYLAEIAYRTRQHRPDDDVVDAVADVLSDLTEAGLIEIGEVGDGGFFEWDLDPAEAVARVVHDWRNLGRRLDMADVCWISSTPLGKQRALEILKARGLTKESLMVPITSVEDLRRVLAAVSRPRGQPGDSCGAMTADRMSDELLSHGLDDWVHFPEILGLAHRFWPEQDPVEAVAQVLGALADAGLIKIGELGDGGFVEWDLPPAEAVARVRQEWSALNREVEMGDVCWVANTPAGDERAREFEASGQAARYPQADVDPEPDRIVEQVQAQPEQDNSGRTRPP